MSKAQKNLLLALENKVEYRRFSSFDFQPYVAKGYPNIQARTVKALVTQGLIVEHRKDFYTQLELKVKEVK